MAFFIKFFVASLAFLFLFFTQENSANGCAKAYFFCKEKLLQTIWRGHVLESRKILVDCKKYEPNCLDICFSCCQNTTSQVKRQNLTGDYLSFLVMFLNLTTQQDVSSSYPNLAASIDSDFFEVCVGQCLVNATDIFSCSCSSSNRPLVPPDTTSVTISNSVDGSQCCNDCCLTQNFTQLIAHEEELRFPGLTEYPPQRDADLETFREICLVSCVNNSTKNMFFNCEPCA
jgi:hypothetical protein